MTPTWFEVAMNELERDFEDKIISYKQYEESVFELEQELDYFLGEVDGNYST